jgi:hypothetical protein
MTVCREYLRGTMVGSPVLIVDGAARVGCRGVTRHTADQGTIGVAEI